MKLRAILVAVLVGCLTATASAAELVMFRRAGCPWCAAWDRQIGPIYGKTDFGKAVPLRIVDLDRDELPEGLARPIRYTPTFVLWADGREAGRIEGYPGEDFFWGLIERMPRSASDSAPTAAAGTQLPP